MSLVSHLCSLLSALCSLLFPMNYSIPMLARIKDLFASPLAANQQLALTLIQAHGLPEAFRDELLVDYLSGNNRPRVTLGIKIAKALGPDFLYEALWFRYLSVGTVGTSYGWVKSFLEAEVQEKAYQTFKQFGYPAPSDLAGDLEKLQKLLADLNTPRLALMVCLANKYDKDKQINPKVWSAFKYLVEKDQEAYFDNCLQAMIYNNSLNLGLLKSLPDAVSQQDQIEKLTIYGQGEHALKSIPGSLLGMKQLQELRLMANGITEVPDEIGHLHNLRILDLTFNPIDYLPQTILEMPRLFVLAVSQPMLTDAGKACLQKIQAGKSPNLRIVLKSNEPLT